jgi:UDP-GlcNAc:undecaprenyl-phosphate/decaprenyl-phosphate GlcNAc-1-phosphate transferase
VTATDWLSIQQSRHENLTSALEAGIAALLISFTISVVLTPLVRRWAVQRAFVDNPAVSAHKSHKKPVAFGGGIAITVAALLPIAAALIAAIVLQRVHAERAQLLAAWSSQWTSFIGGVVAKAPEALAVLAGALIMHLLGIIDDHHPLSPMAKLTVQIGVALMLAGGFGIRAATMLGPVPSTVLTVLWIVALTNAFNFIDNMDGLAAGVAAITALVLAGSALAAGQLFVPCLLLLVAGAVLGFLVYNFPPASIFMGDAGSLVVGYLLAVGAVLITYYYPTQQHTPFAIIVPLLVFAIPIYDMASVVVRRARLGVSVFRGDKRHFSHRLVQLGMNRTAAVLTIYLATAATALPAVLVPKLSWGGGVLILVQCICIVSIIAILETRDGA